MLKVLSIHWGLSIGGVGKYAVLLEGVERYSDIKVHSLCILSEKRQIDDFTVDSLQYKTVLWRKSLLDLSWMDPAYDLVRRFEPDLIMSHGFNGHFISSLIKRRYGLDIPAVCSYHGEYHPTTLVRHLIGSVYDRYTLKHIRKTVVSVVAVAQYCGDHLSSNRVDRGKIEVIHNGIEDRVIEPEGGEELRKEWGISDGETVIGVASRIDPVKGIEYLVDAFQSIATKFPLATLVIVGTGSQEKELQDRVKQHGLGSRVVFAGFRTDMDRCFSAFDIFALPSLAEYHSIGLLEAMRAEKPIVATSVGGNTESVRDTREALVVEPSNVDQLVSALDRLLGDDWLRQSLSKAARERFISEFTVERMLTRTADWLIRSHHQAKVLRK